MFSPSAAAAEGDGVGGGTHRLARPTRTQSPWPESPPRSCAAVCPATPGGGERSLFGNPNTK